MQNPQPPNSLPEEQPQLDYIPPSEITVSPVAPEKQPSGCFWGLAGMGGCLLVLVAILAFPIIIGITSVNGLINGVAGIFNPAAGPQIASIISTQTLVQGIQPLGQLVSISAQLAKADINIGIQSGALNACGFSASHVAQGAIEAGIDLTGINEDRISYNSENDTYTLSLPAPQLTSCRIDFIRQYSRSFTTCAVDWDEARLLANYKSLTDFRDDAIEGGILNRAQVEAELVIKNFVELLTSSSVRVVFTQPEVASLPPSCMPDVPEGWRLNEQTGQWLKGG